MRRADYTIGWICALYRELAAATSMLDEVHEDLCKVQDDDNAYTLGSLCGHNVVIACLPNGVYGTTSAAIVANQLRNSFKSVRFGLLVGIGGGVPDTDLSVRLGDVVVSTPTASGAGVIQYDHGKTIQNGKFEITGQLNRSPTVLLNAISKLRAKHFLEGPQTSKLIAQAAERYPQSRNIFEHPGSQQDVLFHAEDAHSNSHDATCAKCADSARILHRPKRGHFDPVIHYGIIASGNTVMKDARTRDALGLEHGIKCFEMEAAGLMDNFPCLVVRGICDYADSHKNKNWHDYAAVVAAAFTSELLQVVAPEIVMETPVDDAALEEECRSLYNSSPQ